MGGDELAYQLTRPVTKPPHPPPHPWDHEIWLAYPPVWLAGVNIDGIGWCKYWCSYSQVLIQPCPIYHDITYGTVITMAESESDVLTITTDTPYLKLWGVFHEDFGENWLCFNGRHCTLFVGFWVTHWGRVTHICVGNLTITGSDNGLSPGWL